MSQKEKYLEEYNKYKHIEIEIGVYEHKTEGIEYQILEVNKEKDCATLRTVKTGFERTRTLHWCRKHLNRKGKHNENH